MRPFLPDGTFLPSEGEQELRRTAVRGAAASIIGQAAGFVAQMGSVMVLARLLTPADFGVVTMVTTFSLVFRSFGLNGFTELIMQREELTERLVNNLFWINITIGTILTAAFAASGPLLALFYHNNLVGPVAVGTSLTILTGCLSYIHLALLQRALYFRAVAIINLIGLLFYVVVCIVGAVAGFHYWALVWGAVAQTTVIAILAWAKCRWIPGLPSRASGTASGTKFAFNVYSHFAFNYMTRNTDNLIVGYRFGAQVLGFYKKAYDLFVLAANQLLSPISAVAVTTLSRVSGDREQFERYFLRAISILAFLGMGIGTDFSLVGKDLIRVLLGPNWDEAGRIFTLFGPGIGVMLLYNTHGWIHLSIGRPDRWFRWGVIEFCCTASLFVLMLRWGPSGVAFAWTASFFLLMFPGFWYAGKPIGLGIKPMFAAIWKFFAASVCAGIAVAALMRTTRYSTMTMSASGAFDRMIVVSLAFFGVYLLAVITLHGGLKPINDTLALLHDLLPARRNPNAVPRSKNEEEMTSATRMESSGQVEFAVVLGESDSKL